jgi:CHAT domain-containing protein/Tfp pilus assembly protein PilF
MKHTARRRRLALLAGILGLPAWVSAASEEEGEGRLLPGKPIEGVLSAGDPLFPFRGRYQPFLYTAAEDRRVVVQLGSRFFDAHLVVQDEDGANLVEDADSGPGDGARLLLDATAGTTYRILALSAKRDGAGPFRLTASFEEPEGLSGEEELEADRKWFREALEAELTLDRQLEISCALGIRLRRLNRDDEAEAIFAEGSQMAASQGRVAQRAAFLRELGSSSEKREDLEAAARHYDGARDGYGAIGERGAEASALLDLARVRSKQKEREQAVALCAEASRLAAEVEDPQSKAELLLRVGDAYRALRDPKRAIESYEASLGGHRTIDVPASRARVLLALAGSVAYSKPAQACGLLEEALEIYRTRGDRSREAEVLSRLGTVYRDLGKWDQAVASLREAIAIYREEGDRYRRQEGNATSSLASVYQLQGRTQAAFELLQQALEIHTEVQNFGSQAITLNNLGALYNRCGQWDKAVSCWERCLALSRQQGFRYSEGLCLGNLAHLYLELGRSRRGKDYYRAAIPIYREHNDLKQIATAFVNLGDHQAALDLYEELGIPHGVAGSLLNLGLGLSRKGDHRGAIRHLDRALEMFRSLQSDHGVGKCLGNLGKQHALLGEFKRARDLCEEALAIHRETRNRRSELLVVQYLAAIHLEQGELDLALEKYRTAHGLTKQFLSSVERAFGEASIQSYVEKDAWDAVRGYFEVLEELHRQSTSEEERQAYLKEALDLLESLRSRVLATAVRSTNIREILSPEGKKHLKSLRGMRRKIAALATAGRKNLPQEPKERQSRLERLAEELEPLEEEIEGLERLLKKTEPRLAAILAGRGDVDMAAFSNLVDNELLLYYTVVVNRLTVFVWEEGRDLQLHVLKTSAADIAEQVRKVLGQLCLADSPAAPTTTEETKRELQRLRRQLFGPFEDRIGSGRNVLIVPDDICHLFPFETLVSADGRYLVEDCTVRYAPSLGVLAQIRRPRARSASCQIVAYGDPDFGESPAAGETLAAVVSIRGGETFAPLRHAGVELEKVAGLFENALLRRKGEATEARFKSESGRGTVLHVATHGRFARGDGQHGNPLFHSGLAFSGYNHGGGPEEDGFLTAGEVLNLDLNAVDLAVLSACETGTGEIRVHEGKFGLERAFFASGVRSVLGSLWKVDDAATSRFMEVFYRRLRAGETKAAALREAKLSFIRSAEREDKDDHPGGRHVGKLIRRKAAPSHPFYWAPFVLSGDGRRLRVP